MFSYFLRDRERKWLYIPCMCQRNESWLFGSLLTARKAPLEPKILFFQETLSAIKHIHTPLNPYRTRVHHPSPPPKHYIGSYRLPPSTSPKYSFNSSASSHITQTHRLLIFTILPNPAPPPPPHWCSRPRCSSYPIFSFLSSSTSSLMSSSSTSSLVVLLDVVESSSSSSGGFCLLSPFPPLGSLPTLI